jgi:hypothetical protein
MEARGVLPASTFRREGKITYATAAMTTTTATAAIMTMRVVLSRLFELL